jgi:hypothetical protein
MSREDVQREAVKLLVAANHKHGEEALDRLRYLTEAGHLQDLQPPVIGQALWAIRSTREDELLQYAFNLSRSEKFAGLDSRVQVQFADLAFLYEAKQHDASQVAHLLPFLEDPQGFENYLSLKVYEWLWPQLEQYAGNSLEEISEKNVHAARGAFAKSPSEQNLTILVDALYNAGHFEDTVTLVRRWRETRGGIQNASENEADAIQHEIMALDALGRRNEADLEFDQLAKIDPKVHPWAINFLINRGARLVQQQRWQESLAAADAARRAPKRTKTTYAKTLVAEQRACALQNLGRAGEIADELDFLRMNFDVSPMAGAEGLLCAGLESETEARLANVLAKDDGYATFAEEFAEADFAAPSGFPNVAKFIESRPALKERMLQYVRILPGKYIPRSFVGRKDIEWKQFPH